MEHIFSVRGLWWCRGKLRRSETVDSVEISIAIKTAACEGPLNADWNQVGKIQKIEMIFAGFRSSEKVWIGFKEKVNLFFE